VLDERINLQEVAGEGKVRRERNLEEETTYVVRGNRHLSVLGQASGEGRKAGIWGGAA